MRVLNPYLKERGMYVLKTWFYISRNVICGYHCCGCTGTGVLLYQGETQEPSEKYSLKEWVKAASSGKPREERVLKSLVPFKYIKKFQGQGNFNYYVLTNTSANSTNCKGTTTSPLAGTLVACMIKPNPDSKDCFAGARYYKGGRFETIRMADCKN